jgi:branched-subunit amino acid ABC-type transport system permease component
MLAIIGQSVVNGLMQGALIALPALGLTLMFSVLGFVNFSVAAQMTVGAYAGWLVNSQLQWPFATTLPIAFLAAGLFGVLTDRFALAPVRARSGGQGPLMVAVVSIALNLAIESALRFSFGNDLQSYDIAVTRDFRFAGLLFGPQELLNVAVALLAAVALAAFFTRTRLGKAMRAVADNADLARLKGIMPNRLANLATFIAMGLAGLGGALLVATTNVDPSTGSRLVLVVFAASVVGGLTSVPGAVLGALLVGVAGELSLLVISPVYKSVIAFLAILLVLLIRPNGLFAGIAGMRR